MARAFCAVLVFGLAVLSVSCGTKPTSGEPSDFQPPPETGTRDIKPTEVARETEKETEVARKTEKETEVARKTEKDTNARESAKKLSRRAAIAALKKVGATVEFPASGPPGVYFLDCDATDDDLTSLESLPEIARLDLSFNKRITDKGLKHLRGLDKLEALYLKGTSVSDRGLAHLEDLPNLNDLSVIFTKITPDAAKKFQKDHPKVTISY